ncbi:MAG: phenylalanine--tRNA ligase subunit beta [Elusimicrobiota bacterium]
MRVVYSWLVDYLKEKPAFDVVISNLSKIGFSIENIQNIGVSCENVVVAKVIKKEKHPNADKLSLCQVTDGKESYQVVCGAKNVAEGQVVPFAKIGAKLGKIIIKKAKIRGVESCGMICSGQELGLEEKSEGIMVLDEKIELGKDLKELFPPDYVFELEITPNLAYCLSHYSLARELSIFFGYKLKEVNPLPVSCLNENFDIRIETSNCLRYIGVIIKNIKNLKTPHYISDRLKKIGLNPKENILIDLSNYVMFELGQPTHCFDLNNIEDSIVVRMASSGEKIKTLDGKDYELNENIMVIADTKKPLAVAGVIGGYFSSINEKTKDILIEIANFNPSAVRKSSKFLNIKTDSSYRFERGVDINLAPLCARRMVEIIKDQNPDCDVFYYNDVKNFKENKKVVKIDHKKINSILGTNIDNVKINEFLKKLDSDFDGINFTVPSYRSDIESLWDISEEVARYLGYDVIESKTNMSLMKSKDDPYYILRNKIADKFLVFGFNEVLNYDIVSEKELNLLGFENINFLKISNPLSKEFEYLRPLLLPSLLKNIRYNINRGIKSVKIYEFGSLFLNEKSKPYESRRLAGVICGLVDEYEYWKEKEKEVDFFYLKNVIQYILSDFTDIVFKNKSNEKYIVEDVSMEVYYGDKKIGFFGLLNPDVPKIFDIKADNIFYFDIDFDLLCSNFKTDFVNSIKKPKPISQFQYGIRDLSFLVDKKHSYEDIYKSLAETKDIFDIRLIDVYEGKNIGADKKSFTFRFIFSSMDKTFTDEELNKKIEEIYNILNSNFGAKLRE